jgi:hypothetical protein
MTAASLRSSPAIAGNSSEGKRNTIHSTMAAHTQASTFVSRFSLPARLEYR